MVFDKNQWMANKQHQAPGLVTKHTHRVFVCKAELISGILANVEQSEWPRSLSNSPRRAALLLFNMLHPSGIYECFKWPFKRVGCILFIQDRKSKTFEVI